MEVYTASGRSTITTASAGAALGAFRASSARRCFIREIGLFYVTAPTTSGSIGLQRSSTLGTGALTSVVGQPHDVNAPTSLAQVVTDWATTKSVGANIYMKRWDSAPTIGNGMVWRFDEGLGLVVPISGANSEVLLCNNIALAPGTFDFYFTWEE